MNALFASGAKRNRLLSIVGLALLMAGPALLLWASAPQPSSRTASWCPQRSKAAASEFTPGEPSLLPRQPTGWS